MAKEDIFFSAAGKSDAALEAAWDEGEIIADSLGEVAPYRCAVPAGKGSGEPSVCG